MNIKIEMAAIERGQSGDLLCKVEQLRPFDGEAEVRLVGSPRTRAPSRERSQKKRRNSSSRSHQGRPGTHQQNLVYRDPHSVERPSTHADCRQRRPTATDNPPKPRKNAPPKPKAAGRHKKGGARQNRKSH